MKRRVWSILAVLLVTASASTVALVAGGAVSESPIFTEKGALVVVLGCNDPDQLVSLHADGSFLVQGLDTDPAKIEKARRSIEAAGVHGPVSAKLYDGSNLPYMDNLVNVVVVETALADVGGEILRVLAPSGKAVVREAGNQEWLSGMKPPVTKVQGGFVKFTKPVPSNTDEWGHWLHAPDNNPVAKDDLVDVPRHLQWVQGPAWVSSHNLNPAVSAVVTSQGRVFSIINEMPPGIGGMEDQWVLTARDAFNGLVLWRHPMKDWGWTHWSPQEYSVEMRFVPPFQVMRRMVAAGDRLFVTPGFYSPVHVLNAATGETLSVLSETEKTFEILHVKGTLFLAANAAIGTDGTIPDIAILAVGSQTGKTLWEKGGFRGVSGKLNRFFKHANVFLTAGSDHLYLLDGDHVVCLDQKSGEERWRVERPEKTVPLTDADIESLAEGKERSSNVPKYRADQYFPNNCAMVHSDGVLVLSQIRNTAENHKTRLKKTALTAAYDAGSGKELWRFDSATFAHFVPLDLFVIDGLVWTLEEKSKAYVGLDLRSGDKKKSYPMEELIWEPRGHQLCFRNKATTHKIVFGRTKGTEFIDIRTGKTTTHGWIKGMCNIGVMPANGMIYYTPHNCSCRMAFKLTGFRAQTAVGFTGRTGGERLQSDTVSPAPLAAKETDWAMYRYDGARKGSLPAPLPTEPSLKWKVDLGGPLTQAIAVDGKVYVAEKDAHRVCCLDRKSGTVLWKHTVGGRIDSAPTCTGGLLLFGCRDGHVYCLDAKTGERVWRFRAAPQDAMIVAMDQLESLWPVHGSLIVSGDNVYCVAGRSSHLNGGMYLYRIDRKSGKVLQEKRLQADLSSSYEFEKGVLSDLMTLQEGTVHMRTLSFSEGQLESVVHANNSGRGLHPVKGAPILQTASGFLDTSLFNTAVWGAGSTKGQIVAHDGTHAFGLMSYRKFGQSCGHDVFTLAKDGYLLSCRGLANTKEKSKMQKGKGKEKETKKEGEWSFPIPIRGKALLVGDNCLYVAGVRDRVEKKDPWGHVQGRMGGVLGLYAKSDGTKITEIPLDAAPLFDGLSAARENVFLVTEQGEVLCFE